MVVTAFKVIEVGTNRKPVCDFPISELLQLVQISDTAFLSHPLEGLGATYDDHPRLIGKRVVDFLLSVN